MDRIATGLNQLGDAPAAASGDQNGDQSEEIAALKAALEEERTANAQLEARVKALTAAAEARASGDTDGEVAAVTGAHQQEIEATVPVEVLAEHALHSGSGLQPGRGRDVDQAAAAVVSKELEARGGIEQHEVDEPIAVEVRPGLAGRSGGTRRDRGQDALGDFRGSFSGDGGSDREGG